MRIYAALLTLMVPILLFAYQDIKFNEQRRIICTPVRGSVTKLIKPVYPPNAAAQGIGGKVQVDVSINERGEPASIRIVKGNPIFAEATITAVQQGRWKPIKLDGKAVPADVSLTVNYEPRRKKPPSDSH